ncbi:MAG TPA: peptidylprolyl isomerase [Herpetosiphonaceae bacterium]
MKQSRTRQLVIEIGIALILAVVARVAWDQWYLPSRPVAQVGAQTIKRGEYQELAAIDLAQQLAYIQSEINRYEQMTATQSTADPNAAATLFGQDQQQALELRDAVVQDLKALQSGRVDPGLIDHWMNQEVILQGAAREQITVSDAEIDAALVTSLSTPDEETHHHGEEEAAEDAPAVDPATAQAILDGTYDELTRLLKADYGVTVGFSQEAFTGYVRRQQRVELLSERLERKLMPDDQAPLSLQVNANYLLLMTPTLTTTDAISGTTMPETPGSAAIKAQADELYRQIKDGADFLTLAHEHSANPEEVVEPGWSTPETLWPPLKAAVLTQQPGEVGPPVRTPTGWYLVKVLERAERPDQKQLAELRAKRFAEWSDQQRATLGVKRF